MKKLLRCSASATVMGMLALAGPAFAQTGAAAPADASGRNDSQNAASQKPGGQKTAGSTTSTTGPGATAADSVQDTSATGAPQADAANAAGVQAGVRDSARADDVVVTGIRQSLASAQNIKRNSDTIVDAITAQDIGALPDRSVTEALSRVPGVSLNRFAQTNDPDHFSVEGAGVTVRGLTSVRSEFNGRDTFSAGPGGQAINFGDVPAELLGSVEVYKNATAELIEGGLAGTVNLNTRKPFDRKGFHIAGSAEANYGDLEKKWSPTTSLLVSDTWDTPLGKFGLLANGSFSRIRSRADGIQITNFQTRDDQTASLANNAGTACRNRLPTNTDTQILPPGYTCGRTAAAGSDGIADLLPTAYAPIGGQFRTQDFNRKREGEAFAAQWQSTDDKVLFTGQFLRTKSTSDYVEHTFETAPDLSEYNTYPAGCAQNFTSTSGQARAICRLDSSGNFTFPTNARGSGYNPTPNSFPNYVYDNTGLFQSGFITSPGAGERIGSASRSAPSFPFIPTGGSQQSMALGFVDDQNLVEDAGFNMKIYPDRHWSINLDVDYTFARHDVYDFHIYGSDFADSELNLTGNLPTVIPHKPLTLAPSSSTSSANPLRAPNAELAGETDAQYFADPRSSYWRAAQDHFEHSSGREYQLRADLAYKFDDGSFINRIRFGARYADRNQTVKSTAYNWGGISEVWGGAPVNFASTPDSSAYSLYKFNNFFRGATSQPPTGFYYTGDLSDYNKSVAFVQQLNAISYVGIGNNRFRPAAARANVIPGTIYLPQEIQPVDQRDTDAYVQMNFGSRQPLFAGIRLSGNVGLRFVNTEVTSAGNLGVPTRQALGVTDPYAVRCAPNADSGVRPGGVCNLGEAGYNQLRQFGTPNDDPGIATGATILSRYNVARNNYSYWLPSANLKIGLSNDLILRLAGSKVLARPPASNIRNYLNVSFDPVSGTLSGGAGNPFLKPQTAWQFDATLEWYFAKVGSFTIDGFYKSVHNFFYNIPQVRTVSNNGIDLPVIVRGAQNYDGYGKIKGFEVAYQQTYDFLPGLLSGLGISANYSHVISSGLPNSFLNGAASSPSTIKPLGTLPFENLSKHNVNGTIFYEKGPVSLRAAYNWRSKFLLTPADVIFPYYAIFQDATGTLDASGFLRLNKYIKIGVQGVNLINTTTKVLQAYTGDPNKLAPRSYFTSDRRFSFILRGNY